MAIPFNFTIRRGRTASITILVTGVSVWTNLTAKLFASVTLGGDPVITLNGTINSVANTISFTFTHNDTKDITSPSLYYEVAIYLDDLSYFKDSNYGILYIEQVVNVDPTDDEATTTTEAPTTTELPT